MKDSKRWKMTNELITKTGTRIIHYLSGNHDQDSFLDRTCMSNAHFDLLMGCYHQGDCEEDCEEASKYFEITDYEAARDYLISTGLDHDFLEEDDYGDPIEDSLDEPKILLYYLWLIAGDIKENGLDDNLEDEDCEL